VGIDGAAVVSVVAFSLGILGLSIIY
jgi:hypothetical protein